MTAMYVTLARYFGYDDQRVVDEAIGWLLRSQREDGGWNCRNVRFGDRHSSFHTTISVLEALGGLAADRRDDAAAAMQRGWELLLEHRMFKSHHTGEVANQAFTRLSFPPRWHYDVLRGLDHLQAAGAPWDERCEDALKLLKSRRRDDGTWPLQHRHAGKVWFDMEDHGGAQSLEHVEGSSGSAMGIHSHRPTRHEGVNPELVRRCADLRHVHSSAYSKTSSMLRSKTLAI